MSSEFLKWIGIGSEFGLLAGTILFVVGVGCYARAKGYRGTLGFLGFLSCVGLLIVALLPDKTVR